MLTIDLGRYRCLVSGRTVIATKARELGKRSIAVGDRVYLVGDLSGSPDALARIVRVGPRSSALRRTGDDADPVERVIVANADQMVVVCALATPPPRPGLIDRCLVAAHDAGLAPLLCLTKADLASPGTLADTYRSLGIPHVVTRPGEPDALRARLRDRTSVLVGHSGVGKSTLVNALVPEAGRATGAVSGTTGRGRHVSASAVALELSGGGWIIDTPGIRSFGLAHVPSPEMVQAFPELAAGTANCPPGCDHLEAGCALDAWVAAGHADPTRLSSLRRLLRNRASE